MLDWLRVIPCAELPSSQTLTPNGAIMETVILMAARLPHDEALIPHLVDSLHIG